MSDPTHTPRDVKILHLILASMGVSTFQDHVPLMLMDFAYRYTTGVLQDALVFSDYASSNSASGLPAGLAASSSPLTVEDVRLAVASRVQFQFKPTAPKELLLELAQERNKRALPPVPQTYGLRLPPEKYCLTGQERDVDEDDDIVIAGYEKMDLGSIDPDGVGLDDVDLQLDLDAMMPLDITPGQAEAEQADVAQPEEPKTEQTENGDHNDAKKESDKDDEMDIS